MSSNSVFSRFQLLGRKSPFVVALAIEALCLLSFILVIVGIVKLARSIKHRSYTYSYYDSYDEEWYDVTYHNKVQFGILVAGGVLAILSVALILVFRSQRLAWLPWQSRHDEGIDYPPGQGPIEHGDEFQLKVPPTYVQPTAPPPMMQNAY